VQRYVRHFPAAGEVVIFDRSWYNRAGVERVMEFCTRDQYIRFLQYVPQFEQSIINSRIILLKYWLDTTMDVQERRFRDRTDDPRKVWKLSPMDVASYERWYDYSRARDDMLLASDRPHAPWHIVPANDKKRARLNCISHILSQVPYEELPREKVVLGERKTDGAYDDALDPERVNFIPQPY
jgi:polyphosphate kinase 2 (PPK2 family)